MSEHDRKTALKELEKDDIHEAKRDMVMRFVRDQESLQTSQVDLKLVGDETIDIIDSALVVKEDDGAQKRLNENQKEQLVKDISSMDLGKHNSESRTLPDPELPAAPRPPSRAGRTKSRNKKHSVTEGRKRKPSQSSPTDFHQLNMQENVPYEARNQTQHNTKAFSETSLKKYSIYSAPDKLCGYNTVDSYADPRENIFEHPRPKSTRSLRRIQSGEVITARISSANPPDRIACDISTLIGASARPKSNSYSERNTFRNRRTFLNLGAIDRQVALEGPLELEPVHPSEIPIFRSGSAASTAGPYALVQLPPISTDAHSASPS